MGNDKFIRIKIVDATDRVDPDGVLPIESSSFPEITIDVEEGTKLIGDVSPHSLLQTLRN